MHLNAIVDVKKTMVFPIVVFRYCIFYGFSDWDQFTTGRRSALVRGGYSNLFVLDSAGQGLSILNAKKLHGVGIFGGWDILGGQRIKMEYTFADRPSSASVEVIRERILDSFAKAPQLGGSRRFQRIEGTCCSGSYG